ncbi:alginate lyase family protein [Sinomicrobium weinanense]|uniref:Alginate lyase family protein n=1 Tax=Sinomicrobium weinanense TaxID=2842200 RepID=A0A926Q411_9FLAO|nr:alginate lyase family protein [Sinomicrobium weinanense]MBC9798128.1 alginate lyase family protein [Sinomicrobium weinanense]MBU3123711.1 alginate lyase family protein [Sinomicrobium weinanense]
MRLKKRKKWINSLIILWLLLLVNKAYTQEENKFLLLDQEMTDIIRLKNKGLFSRLSSSLNKEEKIKSILKNADKALKRKIHAPADKEDVPPNGDKREFYSVAPYYWPNPNTKDGFPYIHKDGKTNPERSNPKKDDIYMRQFCFDVRALGLAYYHTKDERYAKKAAQLGRLWFIDKDKSLRPRFKYGQIVPGRKAKGRSMVFIDTQHLIKAIDGILLIEGSDSWSKKDTEEIKKWFSELLTWMLTSKIGMQGMTQSNNIGASYDMQVIAYAIFTGQDSIAKMIVNEKVIPRIDTQISDNGQQPFELRRTEPWRYSVANLNLLFNIAHMADKVDIDLWNYKTPQGKSIKKAYEWLLPYAKGNKKWIRKGNVDPTKDKQFKKLQRKASQHY